jgi:hypothetical protein
LILLLFLFFAVVSALPLRHKIRALNGFRLAFGDGPEVAVCEEEEEDTADESSTNLLVNDGINKSVYQD